jgi:uncharacterized membrane protein YhaH (DUF805 family)
METPISLSTLIVFIIAIAIVAVPLVRILRKAGFSGWWSILYFIPLVNIVGIYLFAYKDWPNSRN